METIKITSDNPYGEIIEIIEAWCNQHFFSDFIVSIKINDVIVTEYLLFQPMENIEWAFEGDWWEGEKDIELIGFRPMLGLIVQGYPPEETEINSYDEYEIHEGCTVEVLTNSITGEQSIGWWHTESPPVNVSRCPLCGGTLSEVREQNGRKWRHCYSCHLEQEISPS